MKLARKQFLQIKKFAQDKLSKNDVWHNLFHMQQTIRLAIFLAKKEKVDIKKCEIIARLHDIAKNSNKSILIIEEKDLYETQL